MKRRSSIEVRPPELPAPGQPAAAGGAIGGAQMAAIVGAVNLAESLRKYGHLKAQLDPLGKRPFGPSGDPTLEPGAHGRDAGRSAAAAGEPDRRADRGALGQRVRSDRGVEQGLLLHHGLRLRAHLRGRRARVAALRGGVGSVPAAGRSARRPGAARSAVAGGSVRAVPAPHVPGQDALLGRRPRHADSDSRRDRREGGVGWHLARVDRHGASRPPQRARARAAEAVRADPRRVQGSGAATHRPPHRPRVDGRREVSRRRAPQACAA